MAEVRSGHRVLEPSAGRGRIAEQLRRCGAVVTCVELLPGNVKELRERGFNRLLEGDFLATDLRALSFFPPEAFDRIVMNPPFSGQADIDHVRHAFGMLAPGACDAGAARWAPRFSADAGRAHRSPALLLQLPRHLRHRLTERLRAMVVRILLAASTEA
jgi:predicted RNA methylase